MGAMMNGLGGAHPVDEQFLLAAFEQLSAAIYVKDLEGRYTYVNDASLQLVQLERDAILGQDDYALFPNDVADTLRRDDQRVLESGLPLYREEALTFPDQPEARYFWTVKQPLRDSDGNLQGLLGMSLDIHTLKHREQQLLTLKNHYRATLKALPDLMFEVDLEGRFLDYHTHRADQLLVQPEQFLGHRLADVMPSPVADTCMAALQEALQHEHSSGRQFQLTLPQGPRWFEISVARKQTDPDELPRFIVLSRDISARKQAELALKEQQSLLRAVVDNTPLEFWARDLEGYGIMENAALVKHWGSLLGKRPQDSAVTPDELTLWQDNNARAYAGDVVDCEVEYTVNGQPRIFHNVVAPIRVEDRIVGIMGYNQDITERKLSEQQIRSLAFYDSLTDLPNRRLMFDRLNHALPSATRRQRQGALLLIDLDNFKQLNDSMGHDAGDQLLLEVAMRLRAGIRQVDTAARLGGDEFVVILEDLDDSEAGVMQAERIALNLQMRLRQPYALGLSANGGVYTHHCSNSIGIALFQDDTLTSEELLRRADTAMYQAKAAGRNSVRFYDPAMQAVVAARAALEADLRCAIERNEFVLHFQPQVDEHQHCAGAEALVRWLHPQRGLIPPGDFIPVAEETGLIIAVGQWVLATACQQLATWARHATTRHLTLSVNVSARQFHQPAFIDELEQLLANTGAPPQRLKLELTESLLLDQGDSVIQRIMALKKLGIGFSLDDFGTGYSSLSYLKRLPLDQLKIDRSFVHDILTDANDAIIARTIVALGESLGLQVIAEGVETAAQQQLLIQQGCRHYQGYLYGRPMPIDQFNSHCWTL